MPRNKSRWEEFKDGQRRSWNTTKDAATAGMDAALKKARAIGAKGSARRGKLPLPGDRKDKEMNRLKLENSRLKAAAAKAKIKAAASSVKGGLSKMGGVISGIAKKTTAAAKKSASKGAKAKAKALRKEGREDHPQKRSPICRRQPNQGGETWGYFNPRFIEPATPTPTRQRF